MTDQQTREQTDIDRLAEAHLDASVAQSPLEATYLGVPGQDDRIDDLSIEGLRAHRDLAAETLEQLERLLPVAIASRRRSRSSSGWPSASTGRASKLLASSPAWSRHCSATFWTWRSG